MGNIKRSPVWDDPRVKPPYGSVAIDWEHPLARGLEVGYLFNENGGGRAQDITGRWLGTIAGTTVWRPTYGGVALNLDGSTGKVTTGDIPFTTTAWTLAISMINGSGSTGRALGWDNQGPILWKAGGFVWGIVHGGIVDLITGSGYPTSGERIQVTICQLAGHLFFYKNGILLNDTAATPAYTSGGNTFSVGVGNSEYWQADYGWAYAWPNIGFTAAQVLQLYAEPYAILRPIIRRRYFVPAAAATGVSRTPQFLTLGVGS